MKKIRYVLLLIVLLFGFNAQALRISHFEPIFEMDEEFNNDQIILYIGYRGEYANHDSFKIEYDNDYIEFKGSYPADGYKMIGGGDATSQGKKQKRFELSSETPTNDIIYVGLKFDVKKSFKVGKTVEIKVFDIYADNTLTNDKYRSEGYYIKLKRESTNTMYAIRTDITQNEKNDRLVITILPFVIIGIIIIFVVIFTILLIPSRHSEDRRSKVNRQLDPKHYPIPGVGPLPSMKKKTKRDVIEPEEKVIQPLSEFVSKSSEANPELMNKGLEIDRDMFKDNPTKSGDQTLININPLAFDDGEDVDNDDIDTL